MKFGLWYSAVVRDRHGKVISRERRKSRSFLKQWLQLIFVQMTDVSSTIKDTGGLSRTSINSYNTNFTMTGTASARGIVCGTGNTPVTVEDYQLEAQIGHGYGAGQFEYLDCLASEPSIVGTHCSFVVSRSFVNWSGATITVREIGVYMMFHNSITYYMDGIRDVLDTPLAIPYGGGISVEYTLEVVA